VLVGLLIVVRLLNEEKVLRQELSGYAEYCEQTRYRLIPTVWQKFEDTRLADKERRDSDRDDKFY